MTKYEKHECWKCGCFLWVAEGDDFVCANCDGKKGKRLGVFKEFGIK